MELTPQPGLGQIGSLIDRVRAAGLQAELSVAGGVTCHPAWTWPPTGSCRRP